MGVLRLNAEIGDLNRRVTLRSYSDARNSYGGEDETHADLATVWAAVEYGTSKTLNREGVSSDILTAFTDVVFTIRFREDIDKRSEVVYDSKTYTIQTITELGYKRFTQIFAELQE